MADRALVVARHMGEQGGQARDRDILAQVERGWPDGFRGEHPVGAQCDDA
jgi:hypothetical protein